MCSTYVVGVQQQQQQQQSTGTGSQFFGNGSDGDVWGTGGGLTADDNVGGVGGMYTPATFETLSTNSTKSPGRSKISNGDGCTPLRDVMTSSLSFN